MRYLLMFFMVYCFCSNAFATDKIVCSVNGEVVTEKELIEFKNLSRYRILTELRDPEKAEAEYLKLEPQMLDKMLEDRLLVTEAKKNNLEIPDAMINQRIEFIKKQYPDERAFLDDLVKRGINIQMFKDRIKNQYLMQKLIREEIEGKIWITPQEITEYYEANKVDFSTDEILSYDALVYASADEAKVAYEGLVAALDPNEFILANKDNLKAGKLEKRSALEQLLVLFDKTKTIFSPIDLGGSFYVFYVKERSDSKLADLESSYMKIKDAIFSKKFDIAYAEYVNKLKENAVIKKYGAQ